MFTLSPECSKPYLNIHCHVPIPSTFFTLCFVTWNYLALQESIISSSQASDSGLDLSSSADMDTVYPPSSGKPPGMAARATSAAPTDSRRSSTQLSKMLLCVSIAFLVLTSPLGVFIVVFRYWNPPSGHEKAMFTLIYDVTECLMFTNHSINFLLYCVSGTRFRERAMSILFCSFRKKK